MNKQKWTLVITVRNSPRMSRKYGGFSQGALLEVFRSEKKRLQSFGYQIKTAALTDPKGNKSALR